MGALVKEMLRDLGINRLSLEEKCDLEKAIVKSLVGKLGNEKHYLFHWIIGYNSNEIGVLFRTSTNEVDSVLTALCNSIEQYSQYTDYSILNRVKESKRKKLLDFLEKQGQIFV